jgi:ribosomal protein S18 acetylase RimI-like enzyme
MTHIRPYRESDRAAIYRICVVTGADGGDATGHYLDDTVIPDVFAGPYLEFEPDLAFVVDTGGDTAGHVAGYVIATADTRAFVARYREEWLPQFAAKYPRETPGSAVAHGYEPERMLIPEVDDYPAHLHIDLLPEIQAQGWGRALIRTLLAELAGRGIPKLHLSMSPANFAAAAFYERLGFHRLRPNTPELLGIETDAAI